MVQMPEGSGSQGRELGPRGEATRQRLMAAAEEVFAERGYYRTSVSEITRRAGVAQGTFYLYFESKDEIFRELVRQLGRELRRATREAMAGAPDRLTAERRGFEAFFNFARHHRGAYRVLYEAEVVDREVFEEYYRTLAEGYSRGLREAMAKGEVREGDPECMAYCLMGIGHIMGMRWILWEGDLPPEHFEHIIDFVHAAIRPPEPRQKS